jgi:Spy/CpxP family protein refolding chaperone
MKKLILIALLVVGVTSFAQVEKLGKAGMEKLTPEQRQEKQLKRLTTELNLTAEQQAQVGKILAENGEKREAHKAKREEMKAQQVKRTEEQKAAFKKQREEEKAVMNEKMKKILSAEQFEKWNTLKEKGKAKMAELKEKKSE